MEESFKKVVSQIFNNWTALKLAVEHSTGGPNSKQVAADFMNYMVQYCMCENCVDVEGIQDALEDIMDEEFETVCEDESPKQIAELLFNFLSLIKDGRNEEYEVAFQKLPNINTDWLSQKNQLELGAIDTDDSSEDSKSETETQDVAQETPMEQDGWIEVKSRRKR